MTALTNVVEERAESLADFVQIIRTRQIELGNSRLLLLRGQRDARWHLVPRLFRKDVRADSEQAMLGEFRRHLPLHANLDIANNWVVLAIAQHHGLPTRLLDWTRSPLTAVFFAVDGDSDCDSAAWAFWPSPVAEDNELPADPCRSADFHHVAPIVANERIRAQDGFFTLHPDERPMHELIHPGDNLLKVVIPRAARQQVLLQLDFIGTNRARLFPDLDGLAAWIRWKATPGLGSGLIMTKADTDRPYSSPPRPR